MPHSPISIACYCFPDSLRCVKADIRTFPFGFVSRRTACALGVDAPYAWLGPVTLVPILFIRILMRKFPLTTETQEIKPFGVFIAGTLDVKKSKSTQTRIISILKQANAGVPAKDLCRQTGTGPAT